MAAAGRTSPSVCLVAATAAQSIYYFPTSDLAGTVISSRALDAAPRAATARWRAWARPRCWSTRSPPNLASIRSSCASATCSASGMKNTQGAMPGGAQRAERCSRRRARIRCGSRGATQAANTRQRIRASATASASAACRGTSAPAPRPLAEVALARRRAHHAAPHRHRHGHGHASSQAVACARWLGRPADEVRAGRHRMARAAGRDQRQSAG